MSLFSSQNIWPEKKLAGTSVRDSQSEERAHALHALVLGFVKEIYIAVLKSDFSRH